MDIYYKVKNHLVIADFNIDIVVSDNFSHEFLIHISENGHIPGFQSIIRPSNDRVLILSCFKSSI